MPFSVDEECLNYVGKAIINVFLFCSNSCLQNSLRATWLAGNFTSLFAAERFSVHNLELRDVISSCEKFCVAQRPLCSLLFEAWKRNSREETFIFALAGHFGVCVRLCGTLRDAGARCDRIFFVFTISRYEIFRELSARLRGAIQQRKRASKAQFNNGGAPQRRNSTMEARLKGAI